METDRGTIWLYGLGHRATNVENCRGKEAGAVICRRCCVQHLFQDGVGLIVWGERDRPGCNVRRRAGQMAGSAAPADRVRCSAFDVERSVFPIIHPTDF